MAEKAPVHAADLAVLSWSDPDGSLATSAPLPRAHAEALARAYARFFRQARPYEVRAVDWLADSGWSRGRAKSIAGA
jgi:hypothetical protein